MKIQGISQSNPYYSYIHGRKNNFVKNSQDSVSFQGVDMKKVLKYGDYAFHVFKSPKPIIDKVERNKATTSIITGTAGISAVVAALLSSNASLVLHTVTTLMLSRVQACYPLKNNIQLGVASGISVGAGSLFGNMVAEKVLGLVPGIGNLAYSITTAVHHEITGNAWKLYLDQCKGNDKKPSIDEFKKWLKRYQEMIEHSKELEGMIKKYSTPEFQKLMKFSEEEVPVTLKQLFEIEKELMDTSRFNFIKRRKLEKEKSNLQESVIADLTLLVQNKIKKLIEADSKEQKQTLKVKEKQPIFSGIKNLILNASPIKKTIALIKKTFLFSLPKKEEHIIMMK